MSINDIPTVGDLKRAVAAGQRITPEDVSQIAQAESEFTGGGPIKGGPAATAHSLSSRQMNFEAKLDELAHKPQSHITQEDARAMQSAEGRAFNTPPGPASVSAQVRSLADRNELLGLPAVQDPGPVGDGAKGELGSADAGMHKNCKIEQLACMLITYLQSAADKREYARNGVTWNRE
ncbi:hypothetical protein PISL3812_00090 [Talaromyces islandicus]|uniref:SMP domain-containing protein n=1 Tax=Talaromyces islandicus TaxID=28573 RepID=A0A0U1LIC2_TALIS|nr:hypothetical protein PISL3812_00090 [Talaromyces islandicus]